MSNIERPPLDFTSEAPLSGSEIPENLISGPAPEGAENTSALQQILDNAYANSTAAQFPNGLNSVSNPFGPALKLDMSGLTDEPPGQQNRPDIVGGGMGTSVIKGLSPRQYALKVQGRSGNRGGISAHQYISIRDMSLAGHAVLNQPVLCNGLHIYNSAFIRGDNLGFFANNIALYLESVLSSQFSHVHAAWCTRGMQLATGSGFSGVNAMKFTKHTYQACKEFAVLGEGIQTNVTFDGCNFENCGTHGNPWLGGVALTFNGSQGCVGANFNGCYFEGNKGAFDVQLNTLPGSDYMTHVFTGCNFARLHQNAYATHMIRSWGKNRIVLIGCSFDRYDSYQPNPAHTYFKDMTGEAQVTCIGCKFTDTIEQGTLVNN